MRNTVPNPQNVIPAATAKQSGTAGIRKTGCPHKAGMTNVGPDRLSAAENFADELNDSRFWKIKISYQKRWTQLRRTRQSVKIQALKPWRHSTGPKTSAGKARAAMNAKRRSLASFAHEAQMRFARALKFHARLSKTVPAMAKRFWPIVLSMKSTAEMLQAALRFSSQKTPGILYISAP